ncbi:MAG: hypothetical protein RLZZ623_3329 [Actinomycetota bacterium]
MQELPATVRADVAHRRPVDDRERESIAAFLDEFDQLTSPFDEHAAGTHVTASAIVTSRRGVVLHLHKRLQKWLQPGGHIEAGETPWDAALREAEEETGLAMERADVIPVLAHVDVHPGPKGHRHLDLRYVFRAPPDKPAPPADESQQVEWFPWHRAIAIADAGLEGALRSLQPGEATLRAARQGDAAGCSSVYLRSRRFALPSVPVVHSDSEVRRWMADEMVGRVDMTVAEVDGVIVGLMVIDTTTAGRGWIEQLYLDPSWIGRGLGMRFLELAQRRCPDELQLWTFAVNEAARRFYARAGFHEEEHTDGAANEERAPDVRLRWSPGTV